jgi:hypothetical protein
VAEILLNIEAYLDYINFNLTEELYNMVIILGTPDIKADNRDRLLFEGRRFKRIQIR